MENREALHWILTYDLCIFLMVFKDHYSTTLLEIITLSLC
jgi:hypothetical protein